MAVYDFTDARVSGWPLMSSAWPTISITILYLIAVKVGPVLMNFRQHAFEFRWTLLWFNAALVLLNVYIFVEVSLNLIVCTLSNKFYRRQSLRNIKGQDYGDVSPHT